jgi:hypothetical protein
LRQDAKIRAALFVRRVHQNSSNSAEQNAERGEYDVAKKKAVKKPATKKKAAKKRKR